MKKLSLVLLSVLCCVALAGTAMAYEAGHSSFAPLQKSDICAAYTLTPQTGKMLSFTAGQGNFSSELKNTGTLVNAEPRVNRVLRPEAVQGQLVAHHHHGTRRPCR